MIIYHGSSVIVSNPQIIKQTRYMDFGFGFYTTTNKEQARTVAGKVANRRHSEKAILNIYEFDEKTAFERCKLLNFSGVTEEWLDFVAKNRTGTYEGEKYDYIYGAVADDDVYTTITLYLSGTLTKTQTMEMLRIKTLFNQLVIATEDGLEHLHFKEAEEWKTYD